MREVNFIMFGGVATNLKHRTMANAREFHSTGIIMEISLDTENMGF